jgi:lipopolysaccharide/colanic/teichoic acid biosynthesis glycosyltransferase
MPILIFEFFLVYLFIGYPIFVQMRPGRNGKLFKFYKFKTLRDGNDPEQIRQTKFGNFLRKYSMDELPQLFNILKNDMSFVGPRPLLKEYLSKYSKKEKKRHLVKPGITGLAQINNLNTKEKWNSRIRLDLFYVEKICFYLDMLIIIRTMKILFTRKNTSYFEKFYV